MAYKRNLLITNNPVQLVDKSMFANGLVYQGVTITKNSDGSYTLNGTNTGSQVTFNFYKMGANVIPYYLSATVPIEHNYYTKDCYYDRQYGWLFYILEAGKTYSNLKIYPQIYDLTKTFGKGNEPTTVAAFKAAYPLDLYPYNPSNIITSYKKHFKVSDVCQLVDKREFDSSRTVNGVTFTNNGDGTYTTNGTYTGTSPNGQVYRLQVVRGIVESRIYAVTGCPTGGKKGVFYLTTFGTEDDTGSGFLIKKTSGNVFLYLVVKTANNVTFKPQFYDLTEMYGAGNEPTTVEQFRQDFPEEMYPYSPRCWVTSYKTRLIANDSGKVI